jgi:hypothetical protein
MSDPLSTLRGLTSEIQARDEELRAAFKELESRIKEASNGCNLRGQSENRMLEAYGDDEAYYGYLFFDDDLSVAYRTSENDMEMALERTPSEPTYSVKSLEKCSPLWLRALSAPRIAESLLASINDRLQASVTSAVEGVRTLSMTANLPFRDLDRGLIDVAKKLNFVDVILQWQEAQSALGVDPPDATTRASRLVETLCKHILYTKGKPLPGDQSIQHLYRAASRSLTLGPEQQSSDDLRAMGSGMIALTASIGALRSHGGTAHGTGPNTQPISCSQARLAVNAAGVLATFLMDTLLTQLATASTATA